MQRVLLFLFYTLVALQAGAQSIEKSMDTATFILHVSDHRTGIVLQYATVQIIDMGIRAETDHNGVSELTGIPAGTHVITVECEEFSSEVLVLSFTAGEVKEGELALSRAPIEMEAIEIVDERVDEALHRRGFYRRQEQGMGRYLTRKEINERGKTLVSEAMRGIPGVHVILFEGQYVAASRRRGRACPLRLYLDGARLSGYGHASEMADLVDLDRVPLNEVAGIEVYIGPAEIPVEYNQFNPCGVVLIWSRL